MHRTLLRRLISNGSDALLDTLTAEQHLSPHDSLAAALTRTVEALGVCPQAVEHAVAWLGVDPQTPIGRLRRTELMQLARSIHRFWQQRTAAITAPASAPLSDRPS